jgi:hypothetical protein
MDAGISISDLSRVVDTVAETNKGLSGPKIVRYCNHYASELNVRIPFPVYPFDVQNKRTALLENLRRFEAPVQFALILELCADQTVAENPDVQRMRQWFVERYGCYMPVPAANASPPPAPPAALPPWAAPMTKPAPPPSPMPSKPYDIFLSYSHEDEGLMNFVRKHLMIFDRQGLIRKWWDRKLLGGQHIDSALTAKLASSDIILLLVSASFLSSDYCYDTEMKQAMVQHENGRSVVVPIILRPCSWHSAPFGHLLALPTDGKALTLWPNHDEAGLMIAEGLRRIVADLQARQHRPGS